MQNQGNIFKMRTELAGPVDYFLPVGESEIGMNALIGKKINMTFNGRINCISCGKVTRKSFNQGFCYNCLQTAPEASESVVRPELSKSHFGIARDMQWAKKHDLIEHVVYLAVASELKIGVTRHHQIPARWIDQGASYAIEIARTPNRHIAGIIEVFLKKHYQDRTNWQAMLKNEVAKDIDLLKEKKNALQLLPAELQKYKAADETITAIEYPVEKFPSRIKSIGFDKNPQINEVMCGIKGQYLIFEGNIVLNIRKHNGYFIQIEY